jgi:diguanylate cyclase (GGDEF)-like protein
MLVDTQLAGSEVDDDFLHKFNYLQKTGALDDLSLLRNENRLLDALVNDCISLFVLKSIEAMRDFVIERLLQLFIPTHLVIVIEQPRGDELTQYSYINLKPSEDRLPPASYTKLKEYFLESPYPVIYDRLATRCEYDPELLRFDPELIFPLCGIDGPFGLALLGRKIVGSSYTNLERMYADKIMRFLSIGIQNNFHHEGSIKDAKTGLFNHAYFTQRLEQEIARTQRHGAKSGIIMLDVDHFKAFNDTYGHLAGDEVLNALALTIKHAVRSEDVASRFGGEEFCVLAIECDSVKLLEMSERIRESIARTVVPYKNERLAVTASLGCCSLDSLLQAGAKVYIEMADKALYLSKAGGRNRSTIYKPGLFDRATAIRKRAC